MANDQGYTIFSGYDWLKVHHEKVPWDEWVWNTFNIPKHKVMCWLILWEKIRVKSSLVRIGIGVDDSCPLCNNASETIDSLIEIPVA